ncbi:MAG TPA: glycosyl hydrolase, partial [Prolixibacteraceae bacterium]|nr:glycosyl hydrolase [Prolixibacteraceae bacterium]
MNSFKISAALSLLAIWGCNTAPSNKIVEHSAKPTIPVNAQVFTTAKDTTLRLTQTSDVAFADFGQPLETQVCVFVDPTKTFQ